MQIVLAVLAHQQVVAGIAEQLVVLGAAVNLIVAVAAVDRVVAGGAAQRIVADAAGDRVEEAIAGAREIARADESQVLDVRRERVAGDRRVHQVGAFAEDLDDDIAGRVDGVSVVARAACKTIAAGAAREHVIPGVPVSTTSPRLIVTLWLQLRPL